MISGTLVLYFSQYIFYDGHSKCVGSREAIVYRRSVESRLL